MTTMARPHPSRHHPAPCQSMSVPTNQWTTTNGNIEQDGPALLLMSLTTMMMVRMHSHHEYDKGQRQLERERYSVRVCPQRRPRSPPGPPHPLSDAVGVVMWSSDIVHQRHRYQWRCRPFPGLNNGNEWSTKARHRCCWWCRPR